MRRRILFPILILATVLLVILLWRLSQDVDVGYVMDAVQNNDGRQQVHMVELEKSEVKGKTREEILQLIEKKKSEDLTLGAYYSIPWVNEKLKSSYRPGDRVRIYWHGSVNFSDPPQIPETSLILKSDYE